METKQWYASKRLWAGVLSLITGVSLILTGDKSLNDMLPELIMTAFGLIQTVVALISGDPVAFGSRSLYKK